MMYANNFNNTGTISANGMQGGKADSYAGGGGSGGGSINIFYRTIYEKGTVTAAGGTGGIGASSSLGYNGGAGGNGTISIGSIATGTYVEYVETTTTE